MKWQTVITGDLVQSSKIVGNDWTALVEFLKNMFYEIETKVYHEQSIFELYRGDSFQCALERSEMAMLIAVLLRAGVRSFVPEVQKKKNLMMAHTDVRISIGIGPIENEEERTTQSKGTAFELSGRQLDKMKKKDDRLMVTTLVDEVNDELNTLTALADAVISQWSPNQAKVIYHYLLNGGLQQELAKVFNISQPAIHQRLVVYGKINSIELFLQRYVTIIRRITS